MLDKIKSLYYVRNIFAYVNEKRKLETVKYYKSLQNKININIFNYKIYSRKYIIYGEKDYGKEYNAYTDELIFEGEYLNEKRNRKGKEYDISGELMFEGEYLNGERNGKGKEYWYGKLIFEGEFLNGERNGKGKEYKDGELKFEGEYLNGVRWNGKGYDENGNILCELKNGAGKVKEYNV